MTLAEFEAIDRPGSAWVIERKSCPECERGFWSHHGMVVCDDEECRRAYCSRISSAGIMRRYHADPAFRARMVTATQNRRASKLGLAGITSQANLVALLYARGRAMCGICGEEVLQLDGPMRPSIDHIIPLAKGGVHALHNLQIAHYRCNLSKGDTLPDPDIVEVVCIAHKVTTGSGLELSLLRYEFSLPDDRSPYGTPSRCYS